MSINLSVPRGAVDFQLKPRITVIGIGGAGGNAVNNMIAKNLEGVDFIVANTDAQSLAQSHTDRRVQLGVHTTEGLGAGARPEIGRAAAEEVLETIQSELTGSHMAFITAGMGGGTGTGAAPVVAHTAREMGILTVGVVTKPFHFEGVHRMRLAEVGMEELARYVDTLIIIPNQNLFRVANERTTFSQAFNMADDVLYAGVRGVTDLIMMPGLINLDFADIRTVMSEMGKAMMGTGEAEGEKRALDAAEAAISNPLLDDTSMKGARGVLINITGGSDMTLYEVDEAANRIRDEVDPDANIIFGSTFDERLEGKVRVSVVATGIDSEEASRQCLSDSRIIEETSIHEKRTPAPYVVHGGLSDTTTHLGQTTNNVVIAMATEKGNEIGNSGQYPISRNQENYATQGSELLTTLEEKLGESHQANSERTGSEQLTTTVSSDRIQSGRQFPSSAADHSDTFIPMPAVEVKDVGSSRFTGNISNTRSSPSVNQPSYSRSVPTNGRQSRTDGVTSHMSSKNVVLPSSQALPVPEPPLRRTQTLLERVTGIGRIRRAVEPPKIDSKEKESTVHQTSTADSPRLRVEPGDRSVNSMEEDLDIPTFLRRQIN